jgi:hypothetical protein
MTDHHAHNRQVPGSNSHWARKHSTGDLTIAIRKLVLNDVYQSSQKIFNNWIRYRLCNNTQGTLVALFVNSSQEVTFWIALVAPKGAIEWLPQMTWIRKTPVLPGRCREGTSNYVTTDHFVVCFNLSFTTHFIIRIYWTTEVLETSLIRQKQTFTADLTFVTHRRSNRDVTMQKWSETVI